MFSPGIKPGSACEGLFSNTTDLVALAESTPASSNVTVIPDKGTRIDPEDSKFTIAYDFEGVRIKVADVFTVFLDCFAIAVEHDGVTKLVLS